MPTIPIGGGALYRIGLYGLDHSGHRWVVSETWYSDTLLTVGTFGVAAASLTQWLQVPFGARTGYDSYFPCGRYWERLWPASFGPVARTNWLTPGLGPSLNPNAPEAAYRLQRVGAGGAAGPKGRICYPILSDAAYEDLPHRRQIKVAELQQALDEGWRDRPLNGGSSYGYLRPVIFHRRTMTVTDVTNYVLEPNPVRCWQRWRPYPQLGHDPVTDVNWTPPFPLYSTDHP